jgi:putative membrane protein insertion efficiency factor
MNRTRADSALRAPLQADVAPRRASLVRLIWRLPRFAGIGLVWAYRLTFGWIFAGQSQCKYHPSCSQYALDAYKEFGLFKGTVLAGWRLLRCNPWSRGGVDYAHDQRVFT